jgi:hypothetical protein
VHRHDLGGGLGLERQLLEEQLVRHHAERVHVGLRRDRVAAGLFGGEVLRGAHELSVDRVLHVVAHHLRDAPVEQLHLQRRGILGVVDEEHVVELEIAMHDAGGMGGDQRVADLEQDRDHEVRQQLAGVGASAQRLTVEPLHDDVRPSVGELAGLEDVDDVGVRDLVDDLGLEQHAVAVEPGRQQALVHDLQRGALTNVLMDHGVDRPHAATAQLALDQPRAGLGTRRQDIGARGCPR